MRRRLSGLRRATSALLAAALIFQLLGCGTILYPERRDQPAGKLDTGIVILDGIGLFIFLIPGVIAFAVDFMTGAIYLPKGEKSRVFGAVQVLHVDSGLRDPAALAELIERETGVEVSLEDARAVALRGLYRDDVENRVRTANLAIASAH